jgi:hypothetical protein
MLKIIKINEVRVMFNEEEHEEAKRTLGKRISGFSMFELLLV